MQLDFKAVILEGNDHHPSLTQSSSLSPTRQAYDVPGLWGLYRGCRLRVWLAAT